MDKIGKYEVLRKIGAGGFASVYEGRDPYLKRRVAIKTCATDSEDIRQRFYREAEIAGNLEHRNVVMVFDFGFEDTVPYLVQEYLPGEDLDHRMNRREPFPTPLKLEILEQIAEGLTYAHGQGVIHRDIKPGNVRLLEDGRVKIMDFGIARLQSVETRLTKAGMTVGTAAYLSPEQVRGEPGETQADVWAWGVLAYELLSGAKPFDAPGMAGLLDLVLGEEPKPLDVVWKECPPQLAALVARCLEKNPGKRYASFADVLADLRPMVRAATARPPAAALKEAVVDSDKTMRMSAEELQRLANESREPPTDPDAITAERAAQPGPAAPLPAAPVPVGAAAGETAGSEGATRVLPAVAAAAAPSAAPPAAAPAPPPAPVPPAPPVGVDPGRTSVLPPLPEFPPLSASPAAAAPPKPPAHPPAARPAAPAATAAKPVTKPAAAARPPAARSQKSVLPLLLIALGALVLLTAVAAIFWFVVRPRLMARMSAGEPAPLVQESVPSAPADTVAPPTDAAPVSSKATLTLAAASRAGATVTIDGGLPIPLASGLSLEMAPGGHVLQFSAPGAVSETRQILVEAGVPQTPEVPQLADLPAAPVRKPRPRVTPPPAPAPAAPEPEPVVEEPPPPPPVRRGDLVEFGPGVVRPKLLKPLSAEYPAAARRARAEARIGIAVLVDENGRVTDARVAEGDGSRLGFEEVSLAAARKGTFQPATKDGVPVKMWHTVYLSFRSQ
jgi:serine/threonine-protein kinase